MRTVLIAYRNRVSRSTVLHLGMSWGALLVVLAVAAPAAAQQYKSDRDLLTHQTCTELSSEDCNRLGRLKEGEARHQANKQARRNKLLRLPTLPDDRNVLLGSWRLEDAGQGAGATGLGQRKGTGGADAMFRELWTTLESNPDKLFCNPMMFGHGITFAPSTYSIQALDGSVSRSSIDYRSTEKQVIVAIPGNMEMDLHFQIAGPNRILFRGSCALVRVGAPAANAAANTTAAPSNARMAAASPSALPAAGTAPQVAAVAPAPPRSTAVAAVTGSPLPQTLEDVGFRCGGKTLIMVKFCARGGPNADCSVCQLGEPKDRSADSCGLTTRAQLSERIGGCEEGKVVLANDGAATFAPAARR